MRIEIIEKNYRLNEKTKNLICEKLAKFERYFEDDAVAKVTPKVIGKKGTKTVKYEIEITIFFGSNMVRAEVASDKMSKSLDLALPKIEGQIRKYRTQLDKVKRQLLMKHLCLIQRKLRKNNLLEQRLSIWIQFQQSLLLKRWNLQITISMFIWMKHQVWLASFI